MAYNWKGMRKIPWNQVKQMHKKGELEGCFRLYDDGTERMIETGYDFVDDVLDHYEKGGEFGEELPTVELTLPDGKKIETPEVVDISAIGTLDELEYSLWNTIEEYLVLFGIRTHDDEPDWATVKAVQDSILTVLIDAGVNFKLFTDEKQEEIKKAMKEKENEANGTEGK